MCIGIISSHVQGLFPDALLWYVTWSSVGGGGPGPGQRETRRGRAPGAPRLWTPHARPQVWAAPI
jgi:hypothetical protein